MIQGHEAFQIEDSNGKNHLTLEVNWSEDSKVKDCQLVKVTMRTDKGDYTAIIRRDLFYSFLFAIGRAEEQREIIPQTLTKVRWLETVLGIKATKDIRKGEMINVPVKLSIPLEKQAVITKGRNLIK